MLSLFSVFLTLVYLDCRVCAAAMRRKAQHGDFSTGTGFTPGAYSKHSAYGSSSSEDDEEEAADDDPEDEDMEEAPTVTPIAGTTWQNAGPSVTGADTVQPCCWSNSRAVAPVLFAHTADMVIQSQARPPHYL